MQDNVMEEQMSLFDMGGLTDDGAMRDPVSGNDVPPGSMASEVRDDVPAMLSEGEYIVPADVVRYYGVRFFEDLRSQAKSGLMEMERNGRIGGEPVPGPGPSMEGELTPEEMAMLAEITGMYGGGMVRKGYQAGGLETGMTQEDFMNQAAQAGQFQLPSSVFTPSAPATAATTFTPVMLYGPDGIAILATSQEQYNDLIGQGYTTEPRVTPTTAPADFGGDEGGIEIPEVTTGEGMNFRLDDEDLESLREDPLAFGTDALGGDSLIGTRQLAGAGTLLGGMPGLIAGGLVGAAMELNNVAKAKAALELARSRDLEGTPEFTALESRLESAIKDMSGGARLLERLGLGSGENFLAQARGDLGTTPAGVRTPTGGGGSTERDGGETPAITPAPERDAVTFTPEGTVQGSGQAARPGSRPAPERASEEAVAARVSADSRAAAQEAAEELGVSLATRGRATGGLVARRKKPVAKKK